MKKLIISIITGSVLIGIGIGVLFMEIAEFSVSETYPAVMQQSSKNFTFNDDEIFNDSDGKNILINTYLGEYFYDYGKTEIIEDPTVEGAEFTIKYRGIKPRFSFHGAGYYEYGRGEQGRVYEYYLNAQSEDLMPKDILSAAEYMCKNKTFVKYMDMFYVEKVTIRTNHPELIVCD